MSKEETSSSGIILKPQTVMEIRNVSEPKGINRVGAGKQSKDKRDSSYLKSNTTKIRDIGNHLDIHITDLTQQENQKTPRIEAIKIPEMPKNMIEEYSYNSEALENEESEDESNTIELYVEKLREIAKEAVGENNKALRSIIDTKITYEEITKMLDSKIKEIKAFIFDRFVEYKKERVKIDEQNNSQITQLEQKIIDFIQNHKIERSKDFYDLHCEIREFYTRVKKSPDSHPTPVEEEKTEPKPSQSSLSSPAHNPCVPFENITQTTEDFNLGTKSSLKNILPLSNDFRKSFKKMFSPSSNYSPKRKPSHKRLIKPIKKNHLKINPNSQIPKPFKMRMDGQESRSPSRPMKMPHSRGSSLTNSLFEYSRNNNSLPRLN